MNNKPSRIMLNAMFSFGRSDTDARATVVVRINTLMNIIAESWASSNASIRDMSSFSSAIVESFLTSSE